MDTHLQKIASLCRFCGEPAKTKTKSGKGYVNVMCFILFHEILRFYFALDTAIRYKLSHVQEASTNKTICHRFLFFFTSYHDFKIKGPEGTPVNVMHESGNRDPFALQCILPSAEQIPEALLDIELTSKSAKKSYTLRDVAGRQIGRMQYFLNRELKELMDCGKVNGIKG